MIHMLEQILCAGRKPDPCEVHTHMTCVQQFLQDVTSHALQLCRLAATGHDARGSCPQLVHTHMTYPTDTHMTPT